MPRFFLDSPPRADRVRLAGREARHALQVFRVREGDTLTLFDGTGWEYDAVVVSRRGGSAELDIRSRRRVDREPPAAVTVAVAVPRGKRMAQIVRSASELGAERIVPLVSERTILRLAASPEDSLARWEQIAIEASKQSGRGRVTRVEPLRPLAELLPEGARHAAALFASTEPDSPSLGARVRAFAAAPASILVAVGPEGDFSPTEVDAMERAGFRPFSLGRSILRVETAAVSALASLLALLAAQAD
jgi:16S rRNA (uracil1498-N3)-methyltransferase